MDYTHTGSMVDIIHWGRTLCLWGTFSDIWQRLWHLEPFHVFRIGCSAKIFNRWLPGWLCPTCVTATWVPSWINVILIWYHYIVICTFTICTLAIFNSWLSSKDMKLRVLIKEVLVVFYWLTFRIIYIYIYIFIFYIYIYIYIFIFYIILFIFFDIWR